MLHATSNMFEVIKYRSLLKKLSKAIITRTKLRNNFLQNKSEENEELYAKERNLWVSLLGMIRRRYYENLNETSVIDNKIGLKKLSVRTKFI